ncbi:MAG: phosphate/phosphite/phosphonate ABC transporter substrate-binding protein [Dehalococcoidia bacterium]
MHLQWRHIAVAAIGVTALAAAACGGNTEKPAADPAAAAKTSAQATATVDPRAGWPKKFVVGYFGGDDAEALLKKQDPFKKHLEEKLGMPVELFTGTSYNAVIEAMRADRVDAMAVGPFSYTLAVQEAQAEALGVSVSCASSVKECKFDASAAPFYQSIVFTKKGSGINKLEDFKGKGFNFVDPASTSGHLAPKTLLIKKGFDPDKEFKTVFAGSHPTSVLSVWNGKAPGGATHEGNLLNLVNSKQVEACLWADGKIAVPRTQEEVDKTFAACPDGKLAILAVSDPIPNTPFAIRQELPATFKKAVKDALLEIKDKPEMVGTLRYWYVDPHEELKLQTLDAFYNPLRDIAKLLKLDLKELN